MPLLEVRRVSKQYQNEGATAWALRDVSLTVERGEFVALVGRSGCGKSSLLNLCGAVDVPTQGEICLGGASLGAMKDVELTRIRREKIGFIFQSFQLLPALSVLENVEVPLQLARRAGTRRTALERLRWVELDGLADRLPHQLSGGQQQRVAIARALVSNPALVLADEPTGNLDSATGEVVVQLLRRLTDEFDAAVVMATHSADSAARVDRLIRLRDGHIEA